MANCTRCGQDNPQGSKFCMECGAPLQQIEDGFTPDHEPYAQAGYSYQSQQYQQPFEQNYQSDYNSGYQGGYQGGYDHGQGGFDNGQYRQQPFAQPYQGGYAPVPAEGQYGEKSKIAAGLLAILLGSLGIHKFYLGYTSTGVIMLLVTLLTFGIGAVVMGIIALIEGIIYLTKSDYDFYMTYEANQKKWF